MKYWLLKSEPDAWSWENQVKEGASMWEGVRNYQARNNLKEMKKNDLCFFYHSVTERSIVGIVKVVACAFKIAACSLFAIVACIV